MAVAGGSLADVAREHTSLSDDAVNHLKRLAASWGVIADLCFSDLLLFGPATGRDDRFIVLGQVRANTGQTLYPEDRVGQAVAEQLRPLIAKTWQSGEP